MHKSAKSGPVKLGRHMHRCSPRLIPYRYVMTILGLAT